MISFWLIPLGCLFSFLQNDERKLKIKIQFIANPVCYLGDREKITLNSWNFRMFVYKTKIIILIISGNITTSNREHSKNKHINDKYTLHYLAFGTSPRWSLEEKEKEKERILYLTRTKCFLLNNPILGNIYLRFYKSGSETLGNWAKITELLRGRCS